MGFKCGIIGLPNTGKSTLFNALTKANVEVANFPFCTIKPNIGIVAVPDSRLNQLAKIVKPQRILSTTMKFVDIAGLVKGASKGEGLGNQFLSNIREMEVIGHVVRCFENENIVHITGHIDPLKDINIINTELILADLDICERNIYYAQKKVKNKNKDTENILRVLNKCLFHLENTKMLHTLMLNKEEKDIIFHLKFLTLKPIMYIANISTNYSQSNHYINVIDTFAKKNKSIMVPICAIIENDLAKLNEEYKRKEFMNNIGIVESGLNHIIQHGYKLLKLHTFFTICAKEIRAWTIKTGITALQAASKIHTDFKKGFIRAEIISFADFIYYNGKQGAKVAGKVRIEGKNYIVQDGDIINFLINLQTSNNV